MTKGKNRLVLLVLLFVLVLGMAVPALAAEDGIAIDETNFPDEAFRSYVADRFDLNGDNRLSASECEKVKTMYLDGKNIASLEGIGFFPALTELWCQDNRLTSLDVSQNPGLLRLECARNSLTSLNLSGTTDLTTLDCSYNRLTTLDVSRNPALKKLDCYENRLTTLDVSRNLALTDLFCSWNQLTSLNLTENSALEKLTCSGNAFYAYVGEGQTFDLSGLPGFDLSRADSWDGGTVTGTVLRFQETEVTYRYRLGNGFFGTFTLIRGSIAEDVLLPVDEANFPDAAFRTYVSKNLDDDGDGMLSAMERCDASAIILEDKGCTSLEGIAYFPNLTTLRCAYNQLTQLDVSRNSYLESLYCGFNQLTNLNLSKNHKLGTNWGEIEPGQQTYTITLRPDRSFDLSTLPGNFDVSQAMDWKGGYVIGNTLLVNADSQQVTYRYKTGRSRYDTPYCLEVTLYVIQPETPDVDTVLRLYNPGNGKHHYTIDAAERDFLAANGWIYEGIAWNAPKEGAPIYRVYNPGNDNHLYTMDAAERDRLVDGGWKYEGILCYSADETGTPLYRVFNPYVTQNPHHYTDSLEECAFLQSNGWIVEGISWYGLK